MYRSCKNVLRTVKTVKKETCMWVNLMTLRFIYFQIHRKVLILKGKQESDHNVLR